MALQTLSASIVLRRLRPGSLLRNQVLNLGPTTCMHQQHLHFASKSSSGSADSGSKDTQPKRLSGILARILQQDSSGESPILRMMGYYSTESKAIGAANSMYDQIRQRATSAVGAEFTAPDTSAFVPQFEMLALHVYLTLRRLRFEKGSAYENDVQIAMQTLFDNFWTDVRSRMMIEEHKLTLLQSGKWIKQCEKNFFAMALSFDEAWDNQDKMFQCIEQHINSLRKDESKIRRIMKYMQRERARLDKVTVEQIWEGDCWDPTYPAIAH